MSDRDDAPTLARRLVATLTHLRDAWGVQYVPGGLPVAQSAPSVPSAHRPPSAPAQKTAATPATPDPAAKAQRAKALRAQAQSWSPATKLEYLRQHNVGDCRRCGLCRTRTNIVFGVGSAEADIIFVGEAPGADEDRQGEPFVGRAGQRLTKWIEALGLTRDAVYIANVLKCRPPGNRDPKPDEVDKCSPFLRAQIRAIAPKVIVALGRHAGMLLSRREDLSLRAMRGTSFTYDATGPRDAQPYRIPLVVTYHPAYVLRQEGSGGGSRSPAEGKGPASAAGRGQTGSAEELVMTDLRRALALV